MDIETLTVATPRRPLLSVAALILGALALVAAVGHEATGPLIPPQTIEAATIERAQSLKERVSALWEGEAAPPPKLSAGWTLDRGLAVSIALAAALSVALGVIGFVRHEPARGALAAALLGAGALAFQFFVAAVALGLAVLGLVVASRRLELD